MAGKHEKPEGTDGYQGKHRAPEAAPQNPKGVTGWSVGRTPRLSDSSQTQDRSSN